MNKGLEINEPYQDSGNFAKDLESYIDNSNNQENGNFDIHSCLTMKDGEYIIKDKDSYLIDKESSSK